MNTDNGSLPPYNLLSGLVNAMPNSRPEVKDHDVKLLITSDMSEDVRVQLHATCVVLLRVH